jgi:hypothetical protein
MSERPALRSRAADLVCSGRRSQAHPGESAGPNQPLESNGSLGGRQKNRRIEFQIIE